MGFRFRKSFKIAPGIKLNLNKKSAGVTFGGKGVHYTVNSKGKRTSSVGIPGTGLYYTSTSSSKSKKKKSHDINNRNAVEPTSKERKTMDKNWYKKTWFIILMLICFFPVGLFLMWKYTKWNKVAKIVITVVIALFCIIAFAGDSEESELPEENIITTTESSSIVEEHTTTEADSQPENTTQTTETTIETTTENETTTKEETTTEAETTTKTEVTTKVETTTQNVTTTKSETTTQEQVEMVWIPKSGGKYHCIPDCSGMKNPKQCTIDEAIKKGYIRCSNCY